MEGFEPEVVVCSLPSTFALDCREQPGPTLVPCSSKRRWQQTELRNAVTGDEIGQVDLKVDDNSRGECADPGGTAMPGQHMTGPEQAP